MEIWPDHFMELDAFGKWLQGMGVGISGVFPYDGLRLLWHLGLLRADFVISPQEMNVAGFEKLSEENNQTVFADVRRVSHRPEGWASAARTLSEFPLDAKPYFHQFRLFTVRRLKDLASLRIAESQMLLNAEGLHKLVDMLVGCFNLWTGNADFPAWVDYVNDVPTLAAAIEPCVQDDIFGGFRVPWRMHEKEYRRTLEQHWAEVAPMISVLGKNDVEKLLANTARDRDRLDDNRDLHTFLRLCAPEVWQRLNGALGSAFVYRLMGETIRRGAERALAIELREEDEIGHGFVPFDFKQKKYGVARLLDGERIAAADFVRSCFKDFRVAARWYVEGDTEAAFIRECLSDGSQLGVVVANLSGRVCEKGIAFAESLHADENNGIFSFILVDADRRDYVKAVRSEARRDTFCGGFFLSDPDFEFANFDVSELTEVAWRLVLEQAKARGEEPPTTTLRDKLALAVANTSSAKNFEEAARKELFAVGFRFSKGTAWGEALARFTAESPDRTTLGTRPIVEAVRMVAASTKANFTRWRHTLRIDPETGRLVARLP